MIADLEEDLPFEDDAGEDDRELKAQWAISEDPDVAQLTHYIEKSGASVVCFLLSWQSICSIKRDIPKMQPTRCERKEVVLLSTSALVLVLPESNTLMPLGSMIYPSLPIILRMAYLSARYGIIIMEIILRPGLDVIRRNRILNTYCDRHEVPAIGGGMIRHAGCRIIHIDILSRLRLVHQARRMLLSMT